MDCRKIKEQLEETFLSCNICLEPARDNGTELQQLPCQHSFCGICLTKWKKKQMITCPNCREKFPVPKGGKFPIFRYAEDLAEFVSKITNDGPQMTEVPPNPSICPPKIKAMPILIRKFKFILPQQVNMCWGKSGKLYTTNYGDNPLKPQGLYCIDVKSGKVKGFGDFDSTYGQVLFVEDELFVVNSSERLIEVYQDERFIRRWTWTSLSCQQFSLMARHPLGGVLLLFKTVKNRKSFMCELLHADRDGQTILIQPDDRSATRRLDMVMKYGVMSVYDGSIWLVNKTNFYLYEIPVEQTPNGIKYQEEICHCRLPADSFGIAECDKSGILYRQSNSNTVKMLDLTMLSQPTKPQHIVKKQVKKRERNCISKAASNKSEKCSSILFKDVQGRNVKVAASYDGFYAVLADDSTLNIYSKDETLTEPIAGEKIEAQHLTMSNNPSKLRSKCYKFLGETCNFLKFQMIVVGVLTFVWSVYLWCIMPKEERNTMQKKLRRIMCEEYHSYWPNVFCNKNIEEFYLDYM